MARTSSAVCLLLLVAFSAVYEVQGTFLLRHYLRKFPRRNRDFRPFACRGMLKFVDLLEIKCPFKPEYKNFFGKLRTYTAFLNSASGSKNFDADLKGKAEGLQTAMSALGGKGGSSPDTSNVMDAVMSMGKTLNTQTSSGSTEMTLAQRKELIISMVKWARVIGQFVVSTASKSGSSINISSLGIDEDSPASPSTGTSSGTTTGGSISGSTSTTGGGSVTGNTGTTAGGSVTGNTGTTAGGSVSGSTSTSTNTGSGMAGGPASSTNGGSATGGSSFGRSFSGKTGSTNYEGSVNYQAGQTQQTATGGS